MTSRTKYAGARISGLLALAVLFVFILGCASAAESYTAQTMRLLHYEGTVEIEDPTGKPRFVMENARFASGEAMRTGAASIASVSLDGSKIITLDAESRVEFLKEANHMQLTLTQGTLLLDVQDKLDENETLDIQTSTMTVGIRGTVVYLTADNATEGVGRQTVLGVLEGTAQITYQDDHGARRLLDVPAGRQARVPMDGPRDAERIISDIKAGDIPGFVIKTTESDPALYQRVSPVLESLPGQEESAPGTAGAYAADGDWTWSGEVTLIAQSASKMYDGQPLTRSSDVLVSGLPNDFSIQVAAWGSQTDAGASDNQVRQYSIYNAAGENVTSHFSHIETVAGRLTVDPAPLTIWTGSASKHYDGEPLVNPEVELRTVPGYERDQRPWRNTAYVSSASHASQSLYSLSGVMWVHGTNPITGANSEIQLYAGQMMTVYLNSEGDAQSITYKIDQVTEENLPEEALRLLADNPELLAQACADAGWDAALLAARIAALPGTETARVRRSGLSVSQAAADQLMTDNTDVRITIDSQITNYSGRPLGTDEAHFTPVRLSENIKVTATGSQTEVGESLNTYEIDWGGIDPGNFVITEELGTLTVLPAKAEVHDEPVTLTAGSASKVYDGEPLTNGDVTVSGLPDGYSLTATVTGSRTDAGVSENIVTSYRIYDGHHADVTSSFTNVTTENGTLTVEPLRISMNLGGTPVVYSGSLYIPSAFLTYENGSHAGETIPGVKSGAKSDAASVRRAALEAVYRFILFTGDVARLTVTGAEADAGVYTLTGEVSFVSGSAASFEVTFTGTAMTIAPRELIITTGSAEKPYDGTPLTQTEVKVEGLAEGDAVTVTATGTITDVGTAENTCAIDWGATDPENYTVTEALGTLSVTANEDLITITAGSASGVYDGEALTDASFTVTGLPAGFEVSAVVTGSQTDAGSSANTIAEYTILKDSRDVTSCFTNITAADGTLTVSPAPVTITTGSAAKAYDGAALTSDEVTVTGLVPDETVTITLTGQITDVGTAENTYTITWDGAKSANYTVTDALGTLEVTLNDMPIVITAPSHTWEYNGQELSVMGGSTVTGLPSVLDITMTAGGSRKNVGTSPTSVSYYIMDPNLGIDVTSYFTNITTVSGTLTVTPKAVTVTTGSASKAYDGTPLTQGEASITGLVPDETATVTATGTITDVGTAENTCAIDWGATDPANYNVIEYLGTLEITPPPAVVITADSVSKVYDGTALMSDGYTVTGLADGFTCVAETAGAQTDAGTAAHTIASYRILDAAETDVTANFSDITVADGALTVLPLQVNITLNSATAVYTHDTHIVELNAAYGNGTHAGEAVPGMTSATPAKLEAQYTLFTGDVIEVTEPGVGAGVGTYTATATAAVASGNAANYALSITDGTLTVTPATLSVTTGSASKQYDGEPLTKAEATLTGLIGGETAAVTATGAITDVGTADNAYTITWGTADPANYTIAESLGTLEVTVNTNPIYIYADSETREYDGTPLTSDTFTYEMLPDGFTLDVTISGSQTDAGSGDNLITDYQILKGSQDVTEHFTNVITEKGTLTVTPKAVTVTTGSVSKVYDGTPLTSDVVTVTGLISGETMIVTPNGSVTTAGTGYNTYSIEWGTAKESNYKIHDSLGTLTVERLQLNFTLADTEYEYQGTNYLDYTPKPQVTLVFGNGPHAGETAALSSHATTVNSQNRITSTQAFYNLFTGHKIFLNIKGVSSYTGNHTMSGDYIYIMGGGQWADCYTWSCNTANWTVHPRPLTVQTASASKPYDGTPLTDSTVTLTGLAATDTAVTAAANGTITDVGSVENTYTINWGDVRADDYAITDILGTLEVTNNNVVVTITAASSSKVYDGTPLTDAGYTVTGSLPAGVEPVVTVTGSQTEAGSSENKISFTLMKDGNDVTALFPNVTGVAGTLTVDKAPLTVTTGSASKVYDGTALTSSEASITGLVPDETATATATGTITDVGTAENTYTIEWGTAKAANYTIIEELGTLEITYNTDPIYIYADSETREYDGTPLTSDTFTYEMLPDGFTLDVTISGSQTDAGSGDNLITDYQILKGSQDVTEHFTNVITEKGTLTVTPKAVTVTTGSATKVYDGTPLTKDEAAISGLVPDEVVHVTAAGTITGVGTADNTYAIDWGTVNKDNYTVTDVLGTLEVTANTTPVTITSGSSYMRYKPYDCIAKSSEFTVEGLPDGFTATATMTAQLSFEVGSIPNTIDSYQILDPNSQDATAFFTNVTLVPGTLTIDKAIVNVWSEDLTKVYDNRYAVSPTVGWEGIYGTDDAKTGIGVSSNEVLWQVGTMTDDLTYWWRKPELASLYEVELHPGTLKIVPLQLEVSLGGGSVLLGDALQPTITYVNGNRAGQVVNPLSVTPTSDGYTANFKLSYEYESIVLTVTGFGSGDVGTHTLAGSCAFNTTSASNFSISYTNAEVTVNAIPLTISTGSTSRPYNGAALTNAEVTVTGLADGDEINVTATGTITDVGTAENTCTVDWGTVNKDKYEITESLGTLTITKAPLTITTGSASKTYDGTPLTSDLCTVSGLVDGDEIAVTTTGTITDAGTAPNTYSITWSGADEDNYEVTATLGVLTVSKRSATISTQSETQVYNGQPIVATSVPMSGFVDGEYPDVTATGYQKDVGTSENTYTINSWSGNPDNYAITETLGTLTVTKREATVTTGSNTKEYDGTPLTENEAGITGLAPDEVVTVTATGAITDVGTAENTYSINWGTTNPENYDISESLGTLTVSANTMPITVTAASPEKTYDGTALSCEACNIDGVFPEGVVLTATYSGSQTDAGSSESKIVSYKLMKGSQDVTAFFTGIETQPGTLTVHPAPATVTTGSATKMFDGTPLTKAEASITGLISGETATVTATGTITDVGTTANTYTIDWNGAKAGNYTITESLGTLEVTGNTAGIVITAHSSSKAYDATPLTNSNFTVTGLPDGYTCTATVEGSQTDKGTSDNTVTAYTILDSENRDVTASFTNVTTVKGSLTINPKYGSFRAEGTEIYNGYPQTGGQIVTYGLEGYTITRPTVTTYRLKLPGGAEFLIEVGGGGTDVGTYPSTCTIISANAACDNYNLSLPSSTVTIKPRTLTITTNTDSKTYDGTPLTGTATVTGSAETDAITVTAASITNAGSVENSYTIDWNGANPDNYKISATVGTLTVSKREATINTGTVVTTYNGTTVTNTSASLSGFVEGEYPIVTTTGSQKDAGSSANTYDIDWGSTNKDNYEIQEILGTLTVYPKNITVKTGSASKEYDGSPLTSPEASVMGLISGETATAVTNGTITDIGSAENTYTISWGSAKEGNYKIVSEEIGTLTVTANTTPVTITAGSVTGVYNGMTKTCSDYTVDGLPSGFTAEAVTSGEQKLPGTSDNTITSYTIYNQNDEDRTSSFTGVSLVPGALTVTKAPVTVTVKGKTKTYDGKTLNTYGLHWEGILAADTPTAAIEATMTSGSIKDVGSVSVEVTASLRADLKDKYEIVSITPGTNTVEPAVLTVSTDSASKEYDGSPLTAAVHVDGLQNGETVTAVGASLTNAGSVTNTYTLTWDGTAKAGNYTVTDGTLGTLTVSKAPLTITTGSASKTYDGTPLTSDLCTVSDLADGDEIAVTTTGTITDAGTAPNTYSITWSHADENNYEVAATLGVLTVSKRPATISTQSETQVYNGQPIVATSVPMSGFVDGEYPDVTATGYQKDVGTSENTYTINSWSGNPDNYTITETLGTLTVTKREATVTTGSASKPYDGTPLTSAEAAITGLVSDETATATATGTITDVGATANTCEIEWGTANSANYTVTEELGTLTVTPSSAAVTVTAASAGKTYDGAPLTDDGFTVTGLPAGLTCEATVTGSQTDVGAGDNTVTAVIIRKGGTDVTSWFTNIQTVKGTLTVDKRTLTVTTASAEKAYDGAALTGGEASVTGLADGETATVTATGSIENVGSAPNTYTISWGTADSGNYTIVESLGTLTVNKNSTPIQVTSASLTAVYDGHPHYDTEASMTGVPAGLDYSVGTDAVQYEAGSSPNTVYYEISKGGMDVTSWFTNITVTEGTLTVTKAPLTVATDGRSKTYDGTPLTCDTYHVTGLVAGESITVTVTGSLTNAGNAPNTFDIVWSDADPNNYTLTKSPGVLTVIRKSATISTGGGTQTYNGAPIENTTAPMSGFLDGEYPSVYPNGSQTDVGSSTNTYTIDWGSVNRDNYSVTENLGTLTVNPATLSVTTYSDSKTYDGTPLTAGASVYGQAPDEAITVTATGTITNAGAVENSYTIHWNGAKPGNYVIDADMGTLTVSPAAVTITSASDSKPYDGTPLTCHEAAVTGLVGSDAISITYTGAQTEVGTSDNTFTYSFSSGSAGNYTVTTSTGTLTVVSTE